MRDKRIGAGFIALLMKHSVLPLVQTHYKGGPIHCAEYSLALFSLDFRAEFRAARAGSSFLLQGRHAP